MRRLTSAHDGFVRVTFTGGNGCTTLDANNDPNGLGQLTFTVPQACNGTNITLTATLLDVTGAALLPPVSAAVVANIP